MTTFDDRERAYEKKSQIDEELKFKVDCLAAKLLGQWAATKLALNDNDTAIYIDQVLDAEIKQAAHTLLLAKLELDFKAKNIAIDHASLERRLLEFQAEAHGKLLKEA